ncbi:MAG TPA: type II toxin-antitoxin system HicB family antitoxin [Anaerolineae bacterium]|nr:type II toxin-antitoxin system HicB family antitoxin [Anaerolineae bacterium]
MEVRVYRFLVVIERANGNYAAYAPDLPGCVATGKTVEETKRNVHEAIKMHVRGLLEDNLPVPVSSALSEYMAVAVS